MLKRSSIMSLQCFITFEIFQGRSRSRSS